jgi:hypothetical protein
MDGKPVTRSLRAALPSRTLGLDVDQPGRQDAVAIPLADQVDLG